MNLKVRPTDAYFPYDGKQYQMGHIPFDISMGTLLISQELIHATRRSPNVLFPATTFIMFALCYRDPILLIADGSVIISKTAGLPESKAFFSAFPISSGLSTKIP